jgi:hypothetical protein
MTSITPEYPFQYICSNFFSLQVHNYCLVVGGTPHCDQPTKSVPRVQPPKKLESRTEVAEELVTTDTLANLATYNEELVTTDTLASYDEEFVATVTLAANDVAFLAADTLAANDKEPIAVVTLAANNEELVAADTLATNIALATTKNYVNVELAEKDHIVKNV